MKKRVSIGIGLVVLFAITISLCVHMWNLHVGPSAAANVMPLARSLSCRYYTLQLEMFAEVHGENIEVILKPLVSHMPPTVPPENSALKSDSPESRHFQITSVKMTASVNGVDFDDSLEPSAERRIIRLPVAQLQGWYDFSIVVIDERGNVIIRDLRTNRPMTGEQVSNYGR